MSVKGRRVGLSTRGLGLVPALMIALSTVVIIQSAALAWMILSAPDREAIMADLRSRPVETVVDMCLPAEA